MADRLIWRGKAPRCRSLCVRTAAGAPVYYVPGDEVPADVRLPSTSIETLIAEGKIERVASPEPPHSPATRSFVSPTVRTVPASPAVPVAHAAPSVPSPATAPTVTPAPVGVPHPRSITVEVGCMEATVDPGDDGVFGTVDDYVTLSPLSFEYTETEPDHETVDDGRPDTAPTRKRGPSKRRKTKGQK
jgi:hypothetical protein